MTLEKRIEWLESMVQELSLQVRLLSQEPLPWESAEDQRAAMNRRKLPTIPAEFADGMQVWLPPSLDEPT